MATQIEEITSVLEDLVREEDVLAAMLSFRNMPPVYPSSIKIRDLSTWGLIANATTKAFGLIDSFMIVGIDRFYLNLRDYETIFFLIDVNTLLVVVIPPLANKGLLEVEIENARRKIRQIMRK